MERARQHAQAKTSPHNSNSVTQSESAIAIENESHEGPYQSTNGNSNQADASTAEHGQTV